MDFPVFLKKQVQGVCDKL